MRNPPTPLSPNEEAALERLQQDYEPVSDSFPREIAIDHLGDIDVDIDTAHKLLDRLLSKGYLYEVDNELRITE